MTKEEPIRKKEADTLATTLEKLPEQFIDIIGDEVKNIYLEAYKSGRTTGHELGFNQGMAQGYQKGYAQCLADGKLTEYDKGYADALSKMGVN